MTLPKDLKDKQLNISAKYNSTFLWNETHRVNVNKAITETNYWTHDVGFKYVKTSERLKLLQKWYGYLNMIPKPWQAGRTEEEIRLSTSMNGLNQEINFENHISMIFSNQNLCCSLSLRKLIKYTTWTKPSRRLQAHSVRWRFPYIQSQTVWDRVRELVWNKRTEKYLIMKDRKRNTRITT